jgi:pSer/pThr/pTyr-binding forkhead associated (FHA) protein
VQEQEVEPRDGLHSIYYRCVDSKSHVLVRTAFGTFFTALREFNVPTETKASALEVVDTFFNNLTQRTVLEVPLGFYADFNEVEAVRLACAELCEVVPPEHQPAVLLEELTQQIEQMRQTVQEIYGWYLYLVFLEVKGDTVLIEQTLSRLCALVQCELLELIVSWSRCTAHCDEALQTIIDGYPAGGERTHTQQVLEDRHRLSLQRWLSHWREGVTYVWGSDKLGEDDEGRVLWETFFQHYFKVMWHDFLEAFEHVYLVERLPVDVISAFQRRMDPKGCQHISKVVWSKLITQAKRCADILQSLVEEVEANIASTIYREEPLQPLAMPADMDKWLRPDGSGEIPMSIAPILRALGSKTDFSDDWVEKLLAERLEKGPTMQLLHPRSSLWIWWLGGEEPLRVKATRIVLSEIALTTKLAVLRVSSGELGNHAQAMENYHVGGSVREALPGLLISPHTSKWCNVTRFGRNSSRQTLLPDWPMSEPIASRSHFNIIYKPEEEKFYLMDASSKWGTFVKLTSAVPLCCGDWIRVGGVEFVVRFCGGFCRKAKSHHQHYHLHALRLGNMHIKAAQDWGDLQAEGADGKIFRDEVMTSLLESRRRAIPHIPPSVWMWNEKNHQPNLPVSWTEEPLKPRRDDSDEEIENQDLSKVTAPIAPLELEFISGPRMGERITVTSPVCTLGRADGNGVQVNDSQLASVSRIHCTFQYCGDRWYLHDNKSTNGTWRRLSCVLEPSVPVPLDHGVAIQAGTHQFEVEVFETPFAIIPSLVQEVMLKCVGIGGNRLLNGKGLNLGANKSGGGSDDEGGAPSFQSAPAASAGISVNATAGSHEGP